MAFLASVRLRLMMLVLLALTPMFVHAVYRAERQRRDDVRQVLENARTLVQQIAAEEREVLERMEMTLRMLAQIPSILDSDTTFIQPLLRGLQSVDPLLLNVGIADRTGQVVHSAVPLREPVNIGDRAYFSLALRERRFAVGVYQVGRITGRPSINCGYPIVDATGQPAGVVYVALSLQLFNQAVLRTDPVVQRVLAHGGTVTLVDNQWVVLARLPDDPSWIGRSLADYPIASMLDEQGDLREAADPVDGLQRLYLARPVPLDLGGGGSQVLLGLPRRYVYEASTAALRHNVLMLGLTTLLALLLTHVYGRRAILHPTAVLSRTAAEIGRGATHTRTGLTSAQGELGELGEQIDRMAEAIESRRRETEIARAALADSEERWRALIENATDMMVVLDAEGIVRLVNATVDRTLGYPPGALIDRPLTDVLHPDDAPKFLELLRRGVGEPNFRGRLECRVRRADGTWLTVEGQGVNLLHNPSVRGILINARDITEQRRLEEHLRLAQRMESIGRLAGGIAHDFNNLLTVILGYSSLMQVRLPQGDPLRESIDQIAAAAERAATLTQQLLAFGRRQLLQPRVVDLNELVRTSEKMLRSLVGERVTLRLRLAGEPVWVKVDPGQLEQVVMNLVINARDAIPAQGLITIETGRVDLDADYVARHGAGEPGRHALLTVADTGVGMDEATLSRIFEPFFTTKPPGIGTGLGLAVVYGIVKQSGGNIWVYSEPGRGTTFKIYLPSASPDARPESADDRVRVAVAAPGGSETILVVEDEDPVRTLVREVLGRHGYRVLEARSPAEAQAVADAAAARGERIDLVLSDVIMPGMSGRELAAVLAERLPGAAWVFMSGYTNDVAFHPEAAEPDASFLQKPFTPDQLLNLVRATLDRRTRG